ncbi:MAG: D-alanine--D-alanine ligase [Microcoleaceae cyanobacterium]
MVSSKVSQVLSSTISTAAKLRVLHLAGSRVSDFYYNVSMIYARDVVKPRGVESYYAVIHPDGFWQLGASLERLSEKLSLEEMIAQLPEVDLVVPHLFCFPGMTSFRALFEDILGLPLVGSPAACTATAANKAQTRSIVADAGVRVAKGQQIRSGDSVTMEPPFIIKPNSEDNSLGVTLVKDKDQIAEALSTGFKYDQTLLVEDFIPGREIRVAVIERQGELCVLPAIEYVFLSDNPIRTLQDKLEIAIDGLPKSQPKNPSSKAVCPATVTPELFDKLASAVKRAHLALGCRDYSLYDFRIHAETGDPFLLEAGLFWSFNKISMISRMLAADGQSLENIALEMWQAAAGRTRVACGSILKSVSHSH